MWSPNQRLLAKKLALEEFDRRVERREIHRGTLFGPGGRVCSLGACAIGLDYNGPMVTSAVIRWIADQLAGEERGSQRSEAIELMGQIVEENDGSQTDIIGTVRAARIRNLIIALFDDPG